MSRTRRFLGGAGLGYLNQAVMTLAGVWLTRFFLVRLGTHDYGLWLVTGQIFGYLLLADIGVVGLLPRETAYAVGRERLGSDSDVRESVGRTVRLVLWQLPLVAFGAIVVWVWLPDSWVALRKPLAPLLFAFVGFFPLRILPALLTGLQDLAFAGWVQLAAWAATTATTIALVLAGHGLYGLVAGWTVGQALLALMCWLRIRTRFPAVLPNKLPRFSWAAASGYLSKSVWVSINQVGQVLLSGSDVLVIGAMLGPAAVVPYVCTSKLISVIRNQPQIFLQSALPGLSEMRISESRERILQATTALIQGTLILSGAAVCLILPSNQWFVGWWVGPGNYGGLALTLALLANMIVRHSASSVVFSVFAFGYERRIAVVGLVDGVTTVAGAIALVHFVGAIGAPLASLASACLVSLPPLLQAYVLAAGNSAGNALKPIWPWLARFAVVAVPTAVIVSIRQPATLLFTAVVSVSATLAYALFQIPLLGRSPLSRYVSPKVVSLGERLLLLRRSSVNS